MDANVRQKIGPFARVEINYKIVRDSRIRMHGRIYSELVGFRALTFNVSDDNFRSSIVLSIEFLWSSIIIPNEYIKSAANKVGTTDGF